MKNIYEQYKPLRNYAKQFDIEYTLQHIWLYSQHILNKKSLPSHLNFRVEGRPFVMRKHIYVWELCIILREVILNSGDIRKKRLDVYGNLAEFITRIRKLDDEISKINLDSENILTTLHRIAHLQFPWQKSADANSLLRYLKILGKEDVDRLVQQKTGLQVSELYLIGLAARGHLINEPGFNFHQSYNEFGIDTQKSTAFFQTLTIDIDDLKDQYRLEESYDEKWMYTWNPLELKPLISLSKSHPHFTYCPLPELFLRRITEGIFFDIVNSDGFSDAYGPSFEKYVGEVLAKVFSTDVFQIAPESPYMDGKNRKHGVDWIVSDTTGNLFIECKTKRLRRDAKVNLDGEILQNELKLMAGFITQTYKNIDDARNGKSNWTPNNKPIYPLIITLEDWYVVSPVLIDFLNTEIQKQLVLAGLDISILEQMPYTLTSIHLFEIASQVISQISINEFFIKKTIPEFRSWDIRSFCHQHYSEFIKQIRLSLFEEEWDELGENIHGSLVN